MTTFPMKVLLAVDGSGDSALALQTAVDLANRTGSELHVAHVGLVSFYVLPDTVTDEQYRRWKAEAQERLDREVAKVGEAGGTVAEAHLRMGRKADEQVIELAEELAAGMVVVGSKGYGTLGRAFMGNDSDSIVRHAPCPVLVVRERRAAASR
ncbi:MAG: universal stress protein [Rubrobacter sp.]|nr:universal stress protein [Rubrobacter sp.]